MVKEPGLAGRYTSGMNASDEEEEEAAVICQSTLQSSTWARSCPVLRMPVTEGKTKPPAPFNEGTLLSAMENPVAYLESNDKKLWRKRWERQGDWVPLPPGRTSWRKLFSSFSVRERKAQDIHLTAKARQLLKLVPDDSKKAGADGPDWEMQLSQDCRGSTEKAG